MDYFKSKVTTKGKNTLCNETSQTRAKESSELPNHILPVHHLHLHSKEPKQEDKGIWTTIPILGKSSSLLDSSTSILDLDVVKMPISNVISFYQHFVYEVSKDKSLNDKDKFEALSCLLCSNDVESGNYYSMIENLSMLEIAMAKNSHYVDNVENYTPYILEPIRAALLLMTHNSFHIDVVAKFVIHSLKKYTPDYIEKNGKVTINKNHPVDVEMNSYFERLYLESPLKDKPTVNIVLETILSKKHRSITDEQ